MKPKFTFKILGIFCLIAIAIVCFILNQDYRKVFQYWDNYMSSTETRSKNASVLIHNNKEIIKKISSEYYLDPTIIAGIIFSESYLNETPSNYFEDYYIKEFILTKNEEELQCMYFYTDSIIKNGDINTKELKSRIGKALIWSIGICQISIIHAIKLEKEYAEFSKRKERNIKEIIEALLKPEENIRYAAFDIYTIKIKYKQIANIDLDKKPEILVTAYNIGKIDALIEQYKSDKTRTPQTNPFGLFFYKNRGVIKKLLDANS